MKRYKPTKAQIQAALKFIDVLPHTEIKNKRGETFEAVIFPDDEKEYIIMEQAINPNEFALTPATPAEVPAPVKAVTLDENRNFVADLTTRTTSYCSMVATTVQEKAALYNAMNNPAHRLADAINEKIRIKDVFVEVVRCVNKETGESQNCPRIVLIDEKGEGYACVSLGVFSAVKKLFQVFGEPAAWDAPITAKVKQISKGERKMLTLDIQA